MRNRMKKLIGFVLLFLMIASPATTAFAGSMQAPLSRPRLMVESYSLDRDYLEAGKSAVLTVTVKNTSTTQKVKNIKLSF